MLSRRAELRDAWKTGEKGGEMLHCGGIGVGTLNARNNCTMNNFVNHGVKQQQKTG